jgi:hypothetical protein
MKGISMSVQAAANCNQIQYPKKEKKVGGVLATTAALTASGVTRQILPSIICNPIKKAMVSNAKCDDATTKVINDALKETVKDLGLKEKGVRIKFLSPKNTAI